MPLIRHIQPSANTRIYVWKVTESADYFSQKLDIPLSDVQALCKSDLPKRVSEWLVVRYVLRLILDILPEQYTKDQYGKPHVDLLDVEISISHSYEYFALVISDRPCGIDVQVPTEKIRHIASKFMTDSELATDGDSLSWMHYLWSAKEAVYKAYGRKQIRFKEHILIDAETTSGKVAYEQYLGNYLVEDISTDQYSLVYAIEEVE